MQSNRAINSRDQKATSDLRLFLTHRGNTALPLLEKLV